MKKLKKVSGSEKSVIIDAKDDALESFISSDFGGLLKASERLVDSANEASSSYPDDPDVENLVVSAIDLLEMSEKISSLYDDIDSKLREIGDKIRSVSGE